MARTIEQTVEFSGVTPERLFELYADPRQHAAAIGGPVEMEPRPDGRFSALGGLTGRTLLIEPPRLIVQTWRANVWRPDEADSVLILAFASTPAGAHVQLVQANVPDHLYQTIEDGWPRHYWSKWSAYLEHHR